MSQRENLIVASILALMRGDVTIRGIAERFGVTEAQVRAWQDVFQIAGASALEDVLGPQKRRRRTKYRTMRRKSVDFSEPTTHDFDYTTREGTTYEWYQPNAREFTEPTTEDIDF